MRQKKHIVSTLDVDEEEIFKSLNHKVRRDIIKIIGNKNELTFTQIMSLIGSIDSPTLSYHLKSLQPLLKNKENVYKLSEIGISAYLLLQKTDQAYKVSKYKKRFIYTYVFTVICWTIVQSIIPLILYSLGPEFNVENYFYLIMITLSVVAGINYMIIWKLKNV